MKNASSATLLTTVMSSSPVAPPPLLALECTQQGRIRPPSESSRVSGCILIQRSVDFISHGGGATCMTSCKASSRRAQAISCLSVFLCCYGNCPFFVVFFHICSNLPKHKLSVKCVKNSLELRTPTQTYCIICISGIFFIFWLDKLMHNSGKLCRILLFLPHS